MAQSGYSIGTAPDFTPSQTNSLIAGGAAAIGAKHSDATQNSFDHNRQTIPGLGLGFFGKAENSAPNQSGARRNEKPSLTSSNTALDVSADEGEISEDEFESLYEAQEPAPVSRQEPALPEIDTGYVEMSDEERDESGSYSPFLSEGDGDALATESQPLLNDSQTDMAHNTQAQKKPFDAISEAKTKAKDAILRLQAANVRYQDYVNEGIDKGVLDQLFSDLGLEKSSNKPVSAAAAHAARSVSTKMKISAAAPNRSTAESNGASVDKSEERKDRIARLLAAKGSKAPKSDGTAVISKITKPSSGRVNSEKSKLLQQKMEALLKSREEKQRELERQAEAAGVSVVQDNSASSAASDAAAPKTETHTNPQVAVASGQAAAISTPQAVPKIFSPPKASVSNGSGNISGGSSSEGPFQKPPAQTQPFLINVSDDDEDTDMDMESPEQRISSLHAPTSPARMQALAPSSLQSPGSTTTTPSRRDLENMHKKIQVMKRKIAEAEAKKRLKLSAPVSPAASPRPKAYDIYETKSSSPDVAASVAQGLGTVFTRLANVEVTGMASQGSPKMNRSRAASERLPMLESRRKEQMLRLKALQSQVANIERELKEGFEEEQKLREDLDYISDDDVSIPATSEPTAPRITPTQVTEELASGLEKPRQPPSKPMDVLSSDHIVTESSSMSSPEAAKGDEAAAQSSMDMDAPQERKTGCIEDRFGTGLTDEGDIAMGEGNSSGEEADDDFDGYEPAEASLIDTGVSSPDVNTFNNAPELTESDTAAAALSAELLSAGRQDFTAGLELEGEVQESAFRDAKSAPGKLSFPPYESPLRHFHSYRFHPQFFDVVAGGLRSATYSNKIDAKQPLCPDEVAGKACPRRQNCYFQHFAELHAPDDQILLQLGAYTDCEEPRKKEYIAGLRELLTDYRNRKVKDFKTISQGILEYRTKFHGDASKVLPLGTISL